ncbi:hypothetical protein Emed_000495 [Eimeria media]
MRLFLQTAAFAAFFGFSQNPLSLVAAAQTTEEQPEPYAAGESANIHPEGGAPPALAPMEHASPTDLDALVHAAPEPYSRLSTSDQLPRLYGIKTLLFGVALMCLSLYLQLKDENGLGLKPSLFDNIPPNLQGADKSKLIASRLFREAAAPLYKPGSMGAKAQVASLVLILSGISEVISSIRRRASARRGMLVSDSPPQRATMLVLIGTLLQVVFVLGALFLNHPVFLGLTQITAFFVITSVALFLGSAAELNAFKNGVKQALATSTVSPP